MKLKDNDNLLMTLLLLMFNVAYLAAALTIIIGKSNFEFLIYIAVVVVVLAVLFTLHRRHCLPGSVLWFMSFWGWMHMAGGIVLIPDSLPRLGEAQVLYNLWLIEGWLKFDQFVHAYGFGATTWLIWEIVKRRVQPLPEEGDRLHPTFGMMFLCVSASMGLGALNEVIEFIATRLVTETNVGDYVNNGWDLVFNMVGSVIVAVGIYLQGNKK